MAKKVAPFQFKKFSLQHHKSPMALGVDSMTLGSWVNCKNAKTILDIGTGCGVLALMCAQRNNKANITGIDISKDAIDESNFNKEQSPWADRLNFEQVGLQQYQPTRAIDLIISNPPYFEKGSKLSPESERASARHQIELKLSEIIEFASTNLSSNGKIALVLPINQLEEVNLLADKNNIHLNRLCKVHPKEGKPAHRILVEIGRTKEDIEFSELVLRDLQNKYTQTYKNLTKDFYL